MSHHFLLYLRNSQNSATRPRSFSFDSASKSFAMFQPLPTNLPRAGARARGIRTKLVSDAADVLTVRMLFNIREGKSYHERIIGDSPHWKVLVFK